jgi:hypothetical protein
VLCECFVTRGRAILLLTVFTPAGFLVAREMAAQSRNTVMAPYFEVDPLWPKPLPNHWVLGSSIGVSVDERDHIWMIHRGSATLAEKERCARDASLRRVLCRPRRRCSSSMPKALLVGHWGRPGEGYEWPTSNHGITVDHKATCGSAATAKAIRRCSSFTKSGKFLFQVGKANARKGPLKDGKPTYVGGQATTCSRSVVSRRSSSTRRENEAYLADGYLNKRVAILDADTGKFKRYWGAYGQQAG